MYTYENDILSAQPKEGTHIIDLSYASIVEHRK